MTQLKVARAFMAFNEAFEDLIDDDPTQPGGSLLKIMVVVDANLRTLIRETIIDEVVGGYYSLYNQCDTMTGAEGFWGQFKTLVTIGKIDSFADVVRYNPATVHKAITERINFDDFQVGLIPTSSWGKGWSYESDVGLISGSLSIERVLCSVPTLG